MAARKLELAYKDALKSVKLASIIDTLLLNVYLMYKRSGPMRSGLEESYAALGSRVQIPTRVWGY